MNRFDILKGKKLQRPYKISFTPGDISQKPERSYDLLTDAYSLGINMMDWFHRRNTEFRQDRLFDNLSVMNFRKEFCTFRFGLPRRAGNTSLALMLLQHYTHSVFICVNRQMINLGGKRAYTINQNEQVYRGLSAEAVIVDSASYMDPRQLEKVFLINSEAFFLIG
jgi:hypothetical protein